MGTQYKSYKQSAHITNRDVLAIDDEDYRRRAMRFGRTNIIIEGDSWFSYPSEYLGLDISAKQSNAADYVIEFLTKARKTNIIKLSNNGDLLADIVSSNQLDRLKKLLKLTGNKTHAVLLSAGGNDILDTNFLKTVLRRDGTQGDPASFIKSEILTECFARLRQNFQILFEKRDRYSPNAKIFLHTYDQVLSANRPARFVNGLVQLGPWIHKAMESCKIIESERDSIVAFIYGGFRELILDLATTNNNIVVVDTFGTLQPGNPRHWIDEIHPTPDGFAMIAEKIFTALKKHFANVN